jgi:hypothetical protein
MLLRPHAIPPTVAYAVVPGAINIWGRHPPLISRSFDRMGRLTAPREKTAELGQDPGADRPAGIRAAIAQIKSGQTVPAEDVDAWIESWDTSAELQLPEPRR